MHVCVYCFFFSFLYEKFSFFSYVHVCALLVIQPNRVPVYLILFLVVFRNI